MIGQYLRQRVDPKAMRLTVAGEPEVDAVQRLKGSTNLEKGEAVIPAALTYSGFLLSPRCTSAAAGTSCR